MPDHTPTTPMFGEVFEDGQMRGNYGVDTVPKNALVIGDYILWQADENSIGIGHRGTGEMGIFKTADFEPYLKAFFGLNF